MNTLSKVVQDAIQAGLPGMVASELKDFISNAEQTAKELTRAQSIITTLERDISNYRRDLEKHDELTRRQCALNKQADELQAQELALIRREAALEGAIAKAELSGVKDTMTHFLRNATVRETVASTIMKPVDGMAPSPNGGYSGTPGHLMPAHDMTTTTKEIS